MLLLEKKRKIPGKTEKPRGKTGKNEEKSVFYLLQMNQVLAFTHEEILLEI
jgi:hypothetical protein